MSNPHESLVTDYNVTWNDVDQEQFQMQEGEYLERGLVEFENGYVVSILRTNIDRDGLFPSVGEEAGEWEAVIVRPTNNPILKMRGQDFVPAPELDHLTNHQVEGFPLSKVDNNGANALFAAVAAAPPYEAEEDEFDMEDLLTTIFGGGE